MLAPLANLLTRLQPVRVARTEAERAAIFRMRYRVYVEEQGDASLPGADHARREIRTPEDDLPGVTLFYIGTPERIDGSLRVRAWAPGHLPPEFRERYS